MNTKQPPKKPQPPTKSPPQKSQNQSTPAHQLKKPIKNIAYIDAQNLYHGTSSDKWSVDYKKFREFLRERLHVEEAYFCIGFLDTNEQDLYVNLQKAGFILIFGEANDSTKEQRKGNVDTDIVFEVMRRLKDTNDFDKIVLVSGDGDYVKLVRYLIEQNRLENILFPNDRYSSLYAPYKEYGVSMSHPVIKGKVRYKK